MQIELNGQSYFVNFIPGMDEWFVLEDSPAGLRRIPVVHDAAEHIERFMIPPVNEEGDANGSV